MTIIDENVEDIDFARLERADMVCVTGMTVQGTRMREILKEVRARGAFTVVGGPMATVEPEELEDLADVIFVGEADTNVAAVHQGVGNRPARLPLRAAR